MYICMYVHMYVCMYACMYVFTYVATFVHMHTYKRIHTNACVHTYYCRFEGEVICEDPAEVDAGMDWKAYGQSQIDIPVTCMPRYIW